MMASMLGLLARLASPAGFVLVGLCFLLPFLTVSCSIDEPHERIRGSLSYSGTDLVGGGRPDLHLRIDQFSVGTSRIDETDMRREPFQRRPVDPIAVQPFAVATVVLLAAGALAGLLRPASLRRVTAGGTALVAAVLLVGALLLARNAAARQLAPLVGTVAQARDKIGLGAGAVLALGVLLVLGVGNIVASFTAPGSPPSRRTVWRRLRGTGR
jgi:hypothetical protein